MTWGALHLWWLVPGLVALLALRWWWGHRILAVSAAVGAGHADHAASVARARARLRAVLLWGGLGLAVAAALLPRWGGRDELRGGRGADVLVVIDCSRSMLATDLHPDRITVAQRKTLDLMRKIAGSRIGLMPFAAVPALRCPPSGDTTAVELMLADCSPELFPADAGFQGTGIGVAVREALTVLNRQVERGQAVLVVSDGADPDDTSVTEAGIQAKAAGVPVFGLFLGDPARKTTLRIDGRDEDVSAKRTTLDGLAEATGGTSVNATADDADVEALATAIESRVAARPWEERRRTVAAERYQWLLLPGLLLMVAGVLLPTRRRTA